MAYDDRQQRIMAYALALTGSVAAAARYLREHSVECPDVSESTLRRLRNDSVFEALIEQQRGIIDQERETTLRAAERERFKRDIEGTVGDRMRALEARAWEVFDMLDAEVKRRYSEESSGDATRDLGELKMLMAYWQKTTEFAHSLRRESGFAVGETWQAECMIRAFRTVLMDDFGGAICDSVVKKVGKAYLDLVKQHQSSVAENKHGPETQPGAPAHATA